MKAIVLLIFIHVEWIYGSASAAKSTTAADKLAAKMEPPDVRPSSPQSPQETLQLVRAETYKSSREAINLKTFFRAVEKGRLKTVQACLAAKLPLDQDVTGNGGDGVQTPLHEAIHYGHYDIVEELVEAGAPL